MIPKIGLGLNFRIWLSFFFAQTSIWLVSHQEAWQSGWMHQSWKLARMRVLREFESHRFRQNPIANQVSRRFLQFFLLPSKPCVFGVSPILVFHFIRTIPSPKIQNFAAFLTFLSPLQLHFCKKGEVICPRFNGQFLTVMLENIGQKKREKNKYILFIF